MACLWHVLPDGAIQIWIYHFMRMNAVGTELFTFNMKKAPTTASMQSGSDSRLEPPEFIAKCTCDVGYHPLCLAFESSHHDKCHRRCWCCVFGLFGRIFLQFIHEYCVNIVRWLRSEFRQRTVRAAFRNRCDKYLSKPTRSVFVCVFMCMEMCLCSTMRPPNVRECWRV